MRLLQVEYRASNATCSLLTNANGAGQKELWPGVGLYQRDFPRWSPDSQSVVYIEVKYDQDGWVISPRKVVIHNIKRDKRQVLRTPDNWSIHSACFMGSRHLLISARLRNKDNPNAEKYGIYRYHLFTGEIVNLTNTSQHDFTMDWISDDVLPVSLTNKKKVKWGTLKQ